MASRIIASQKPAVTSLKYFERTAITIVVPRCRQTPLQVLTRKARARGSRNNVVEILHPAHYTFRLTYRARIPLHSLQLFRRRVVIRSDTLIIGLRKQR